MARLAAVTYVVALATWTVLAPTPFARAAADAERAIPAARGGYARQLTAPLTVSVDGLAASVRASGTVANALRGLGLPAAGGGRLSTPVDAELLRGQRIALDRGLPVTVVDGGQELVSRSVRGTVADLLAAAGIALGPLDRVDRSLAERLYPGDVVRITRIADLETTVDEDVPFAVWYQQDPSLDRGAQIVVRAGEPGRVTNTYFLRVVDGREVERTLLASVDVAAPVAELRRIGTHVGRAAAEIEAIIRDAAAAQGADADQLLRVAWCESRFNPSAYNASGASGLFQFMPGTWAVNSARAGYAGASPFDPGPAANVAAWMFARGQAGQWSCR